MRLEVDLGDAPLSYRREKRDMIYDLYHSSDFIDLTKFTTQHRIADSSHANQSTFRILRYDSLESDRSVGSTDFLAVSQIVQSHFSNHFPNIPGSDSKI